jgi:hypothetical protein
MAPPSTRPSTHTGTAAGAGADPELKIRFPRPREYPLAWLLFLQFWATIGVITAPRYRAALPAVTWPHAISLGFLDAASWAAVCLAGYWLAWRTRVRARSAARTGALVVGAAIVLLLVRLGFLSLAVGVPVHATGSLGTGVLVAVTFITEGFAVRYFFQSRRRELIASKLETRLTRARFRVLQMQLRPQFLFGTLNAISALVQRDARLADRLLSRLGDLLRSALAPSEAHLVMLREELEFVELYHQVARVSHGGGGLEVALRIEPAAARVRVPRMVLQPLVENAVRHGTAPLVSRATRLEISARVEGGLLHLALRDDGPGLDAGRKSAGPEGGIAATELRLKQLFGDRSGVALAPAPGGGALQSLTIPVDRGTPGGSPPVGVADAP